MREDVVVILNEREPLKAQMAEELEAQLQARSISNTRLSPSENLAAIIQERSPQILVLDYLLGDVASALDILQDLKKENETLPFHTILWTDEPSVSVAVSAMKLGAEDYVELQSSKSSLARVVDAIENIIQTLEETRTPHAQKQKIKNYEPPVGHEKCFEECLNSATSVATRNTEIVILLGERGVGRNTIAQFIHRQRTKPGSLIEIDYDLFLEDLNLIGGGSAISRTVPLLSNAATVMLDHIEYDTGELLEYLHTRLKDNNSFSQEHPPMLLLGTTQAETAQACVRLFETDVIKIPALQDRPSDFLPLVQRFIAHTKSLTKSVKTDFGAPLVQELSQLEWPGNIRQLRSAIIEAASLPSKKNTKDLSLFDVIVSSKTRWEHYQEVNARIPNALLARRTLEESHGNMRIAAIKLGTGIPQFRLALQGMEAKIATKGNNI